MAITQPRLGGTTSQIRVAGDVDASGYRVGNLGAGTNAADAVNLGQVLDLVRRLNHKQAARVASTGTLVLEGIQTVDAVTLIAGDRVLVKDQTLASENGIYVVGAGVWSRDEDADTAERLIAATLHIAEGEVNHDSNWTMVSDPPFVLGQDSAVWVQTSAAGQIDAGNGLVKIGNQLSVVGGAAIEVLADLVQVRASGITADLIAGSALGAGLAGGDGVPITVRAANDSIVVGSDGIRLGALSAGFTLIGGADGQAVRVRQVTEEEPVDAGDHTAYALAYPPLAETVRVCLNGIRQRRQVAADQVQFDYELSGAVITFRTANVENDLVVVDYLATA